MNFQQKPGDWNCPACGDLQFAKNAACRRCGTPNPNPAAPGFANAGFPGPAKPGDWNCPACGDLQFAKNTNCRKCGAANPSGGGCGFGGGACSFGGGGCSFGGGGCSFGPAVTEGGGAGGRTALYIKGLPDDLDMNKFQTVLAEYGDLKMCKKAGSGVAYVAFQQATEAEWVVTNLDGNIPEGLDFAVQVSYAQAAAGSGPYGGKGSQPAGSVFNGMMQGMNPMGMMGGCNGMGGKGGCGNMGAGIQVMKRMLMAADMLPGGKWQNNDKTVVIKNLPDDVSDKDLYDMFAPFGPIHCEGVRALHWEDGRCKGTAFVNFVTLEAAIAACTALNNYQLPSGMPLKVYRNEDAEGAKSDGDWTCPNCGDLQFAKNQVCRMCKTPNPNPSTKPFGASGPELKPGDWACPACGDMQFAKNANCRKCGTTNPNGPPAPGQFSGFQAMPGDWSCSACGDLQFARNMNCRKCGAPKPFDAGGGAGAGGCGGWGGCGGGPPAFSAGDWNCPACGDHQFARNTQCRKCGTLRA